MYMYISKWTILNDQNREKLCQQKKIHVELNPFTDVQIKKTRKPYQRKLFNKAQAKLFESLLHTSSQNEEIDIK